MKIRMNVKFKITVWYAVFLTILLSAFSVFFYIIISRILYTNNVQLIKADANQAISIIQTEGDIIQIAEPYRIVATNTFFVVFDKNGNKGLEGEALPEIVNLEIKDETIRYISVGGQRWAIYDKSIVVSGETLGYIRVGRSLQETIYALGNLKTILFISVPLYIILASIGGFFLADRALRPIDYITKTARDISRSHLSKRLQMPKTEDEVGRLSTTFNEMLDRLEASFKKERQFTSDASHELRTPVAIISAQAEQGLSLLKNKQNKECANAFISIQAECRKMSYLISQLLMLNKSDEGKYELNLETLDLNLIAEEVANEFKSLSTKKEIEIIFNSQDNILISADQTLITRMLINLVDNATRYTQSGGTVEISLSKENDSAIIKVSDTGKGIEKKDIDHIFDRFYQANEARNGQGSGLGLSIVKWIVQIHKGEVSVESEPGKGSTFTVKLPMEN
jgi:heavy metal sensor kinase